MEVIRRKFMVGLMTEIEKTMERFERFFRWTYHVNPENQEVCREKLLKGGSNKSSSTKEKPVEGSEAWELLVWQNQFDLQLYEYIESLFVEQEQFVTGIEPKYREKDLSELDRERTRKSIRRIRGWITLAARSILPPVSRHDPRNELLLLHEQQLDILVQPQIELVLPHQQFPRLAPLHRFLLRTARLVGTSFEKFLATQLLIFRIDMVRPAEEPLEPLHRLLNLCHKPYHEP